MTEKKKLFSAFEALGAALRNSGMSSEPLICTGFLVTAIARGLEPDAAVLIRSLRDLLNDSAPLSGSVTAAVTALGYALADGLQGGETGTALLHREGLSEQERLRGISEFSQGMLLGLSFREHGLGSVPDDDLHTLSEITKVDPDAGLEEADFTEVAGYLGSILLRLHHQH